MGKKFRHSAFALFFAACGAAAATVEEAQRIVDRADPIRCEILWLEGRLKQVSDGDEQAVALAGALADARARLKVHYQATMYEYIDVMKQLTFEEREGVRRYADAVGGRCHTPVTGDQ